MDEQPQQGPYIFYRIVSVICACIAVAILGLMIWSKVDDATGWTAGSLFSIGFLTIAYVYGKQANELKKIEEQEISSTNLNDKKEVDKLISSLKNRIYTVFACTAIFTVVVLNDLNNVDLGEKPFSHYKQKTLYFVEIIYGVIGFWPTVLVFPVIGGWYCLRLFAKIRALKSLKNKT